jgi:hypothetical protein
MIPQSLKDALDRLTRALGRKSVDAVLASQPEKPRPVTPWWAKERS